MPSNIAIVLTTRCNFRCKHCIKEYYDENSDLPLKKLDSLFDEAKDLGISVVGLTGGEVILYPEFKELITLISSKGMRWTFVTNGSLYRRYLPITDEFQDSLKNIAVSFDGATETSHDFIRGEGSFNLAREAVTAFKEQGNYVKINFVFNKYNKHELEDIIRLSENLGADEIVFHSIILAGHNKDLVLSWKDKTDLFKELLGFMKKKSNLKITYANSFFAMTLEEDFCRNINDPVPTINAYGDYIFCCDTAGQGAVIGNIYEKSLKQLYEIHLTIAGKLKKDRSDMIEKKEFFEGFNSCNFCNRYFEDRLSVQKKIHFNYKKSKKLI